MTDKHLHIISFDVPYPANYGGVIDVFYKALALSEKGVKIHLHCFAYGGKRAAVLEKLFYKVYYYPLKLPLWQLLKKKPFIVQTRHSETLIRVLMQDEYPILLEGLHTGWLLNEKQLENRRRYVRVHNIEHEYYRNLSRAEKQWVKKIYFFVESLKLKKYEQILSKADLLLTISETDYKYFQNKFNRAVLLPAFHPFREVKSMLGKGKYVLYHGNLSVPENINAVNKLLDEVFCHLKIPFKIAGLSPPESLKKKIKKYPFAELIAHPDNPQLERLIQNAQINILYTEQPTGLKLKLLHALYNGRYVLVNDKMLSGTNLHQLCIVTPSLNEMKSRLPEIMEKDFTISMKKERQILLRKTYSNTINVSHLLQFIF